MNLGGSEFSNIIIKMFIKQVSELLLKAFSQDVLFLSLTDSDCCLKCLKKIRFRGTERYFFQRGTAGSSLSLKPLDSAEKTKHTFISQMDES